MKIVFLNVWGGAVKDKLACYLEHQVHDTDIFCFQEATETMRQQCRDVLSGYQEFSEYKYRSETDSHSQAIFVRNNIAVLSSDTLASSDRDYGLAIYMEVQTKNDTFFICNVHGNSRPVDKLDNPARITFSKEIITFFKDKKYPVVIGGDFNLMPDTESVEVFSRSGYRNLIKDFAIDTTRNHLAWDRFEQKMYYSDYVFLNDKVQLKNFSVPKNEVSDHLPLLVEVKV